LKFIEKPQKSAAFFIFKKYEEKVNSFLDGCIQESYIPRHCDGRFRRFIYESRDVQHPNIKTLSFTFISVVQSFGCSAEFFAKIKQYRLTWHVNPR